jgi:hypothetical protein
VDVTGKASSRNRANKKVWKNKNKNKNNSEKEEKFDFFHQTS